MNIKIKNIIKFIIKLKYQYFWNQFDFYLFFSLNSFNYYYGFADRSLKKMEYNKTQKGNNIDREFVILRFAFNIHFFIFILSYFLPNSFFIFLVIFILLLSPLFLFSIFICPSHYKHSLLMSNLAFLSFI